MNHIQSQPRFCFAWYRVSATYRKNFSIFCPSICCKSCQDISLETTGAILPKLYRNDQYQAQLCIFCGFYHFYGSLNFVKSYGALKILLLKIFLATPQNLLLQFHPDFIGMLSTKLSFAYCLDFVVHWFLSELWPFEDFYFWSLSQNLPVHFAKQWNLLIFLASTIYCFISFFFHASFMLWENNLILSIIHPLLSVQLLTWLSTGYTCGH